MTGLLTERRRQACDNAVAMWTTLANARGDVVRETSTCTVIDGRRVRIMVRTDTPDHAEVAALAREYRENGRTVVVEDPWRTVDLSDLGMAPRLLPVMVREPGPVPDEPAVTRVETVAELRKAEDVIVRGFPLEEYQPAEPGQVFPDELLSQAFFRKGDEGACFTMAHGGVGGAYWVTTMPEHRSKGVGRALMHAVLRHFDDLPVTLSASRSGKPLYDKLGFTDLGDAHWWR
ncbi:Acetyltransferase (GNAT) domain-containing protein [Amycolatopsis pretoriensis]|uniref:Acetyltransferase (GNAT) domain-containing protein n=1 Tax=Amycolatopsis pretoriensis TaxID=218821 RepID=A0A1H5QJ89_9PSEU|nr:GNAT family N-acetyltransferase [Amycolatopsis pretoriensis]SEF26223.1 Acetyltransferase (GNAT) domain-containing protein [Amycolatopsis pretoriensis]